MIYIIALLIVAIAALLGWYISLPVYEVDEDEMPDDYVGDIDPCNPRDFHGSSRDFS